MNRHDSESHAIRRRQALALLAGATCAPHLPMAFAQAQPQAPAQAQSRTQAPAQAFPSKPIRFIVPSPPGGGTDSLTRLLAARLGESLSWQWLIDNRAGAGGNIGLDAAAKAAPDGYTIVMGESSNLTINPYLYPQLPFDPVRDLAPIALVGTVPLVLVVSAGRPFETLAALTAAARDKPLLFASSGNGTVGHLTGEIWKRSAGVAMTHVPYKGAGPVITDLIGGQVDFHFASLLAAAPHLKSGKLRALAVSAAQRSPLLPDVPTLAELGQRDMEHHVLYGVLAPAGTPAPVVAQLNAEIQRALQGEALRTSLANLGVEPRGGTPAQFAAFLERERTKWARAVKESGAKVD